MNPLRNIKSIVKAMPVKRSFATKPIANPVAKVAPAKVMAVRKTVVTPKNVATPVRVSTPAKKVAINQIVKAAAVQPKAAPAKVMAIANKRPAMLKSFAKPVVKPVAKRMAVKKAAMPSRPAFGPDYRQDRTFKQDTQQAGQQIIKDSFKPIDMPLEKRAIVKPYVIPGFPIKLEINTSSIQPMI